MNAPAAALLFALGLAVLPASADAQEKVNLERRAAEWLAFLKKGQFDSAAARVAPVAQGSMGAAQLAMIWPQIRERFGDLEKTAPINRIEQGGYAVVQLLGTFAKGAQTVRVAFDKDGLVAGFFVVAAPSGPDPPG